MKTSVLRFAILALMGLILSPLAIAHELPSPTDSVHFQPLDYDSERHDHRPATKRLAGLNVGEPRTVRMIYFLPNDRPFRAHRIQQMKDEIRNLQAFFAEQMQMHGYGDRTFRFETDEQDEPLVHRVDGQQPDSHYLYDTTGTVLDEIEQVFDLYTNIYLIFIDNSINAIGRGSRRVGGVASQTSKNSGSVSVPGKTNWRTVAHELGHAFGLHHDFRNDAYIMSYGGYQRNSLSACHAKFLSVHTYFNPDTPIEEGSLPTVELISPYVSGRGTRVSIQLKVRDPDGVHQVLLTNSGSSRRACRELMGKKDAVVEFYYYDVIPPDGVTSLPNPTAHRISVQAVDMNGNQNRKASFVLDVSKWPRPHPQMLEKISGEEQQGSPGVQLAEPFVVSVLDQNGSAIAGLGVTFVVTAGGGTLSVETAFTDAKGRASATLTLGNHPGTNTVEVTVAGLVSEIFTAKALATPDFDGDGTVGIPDFLLFVDQFGLSQGDEGYDVRFDLDGDGTIGIGDFLIFVEDFGKKVPSN
ncbi:MAG: M12 family metallo-peptidase [Gemmatimonadota bacterium]|nr:M12 family metallo-peptidase [Gemmatimonadota bacterium]